MYNRDLKNLRSWEEEKEREKYKLKSIFTILGSAIAGMALFYLSIANHPYTRFVNFIYGSGKCYVIEKVETKKGDSYWSLTKDIDPRDRNTVIKLMREKNIEKAIFDDARIPVGKEVFVMRNADCSENNAKSLDEFIKNAGPLF